jgi:hypothetical protein
MGFASEVGQVLAVAVQWGQKSSEAGRGRPQSVHILSSPDYS